MFTSLKELMTKRTKKKKWHKTNQPNLSLKTGENKYINRQNLKDL